MIISLTKSQLQTIEHLRAERGVDSILSVHVSENPSRVRVGLIAKPSFKYALYVGKRGKVYEDIWSYY